jgi:hypothetical protein
MKEQCKLIDEAMLYYKWTQHKWYKCYHNEAHSYQYWLRYAHMYFTPEMNEKMRPKNMDEHVGFNRILGEQVMDRIYGRT